jgi:glycosyltransferase involved in cell wall biosynthesis
MEISIIIPTYNGAKKISRILNSLLRQSLSKFQVIVVIDGSTDATLQVLQSYLNRFDDILIIEQKNKGRAAVRNKGALTAKGDLLIFYDDDMEAYPDSVQKHATFHSVNDRSILCGYTVEEFSKEKTDIQNYKAALVMKWTSDFSDGLNLMSPQRLFLTAANMSITKKLFNELNGFDERLFDIEDLEFATRASDRQIRIYFDKQNRATHHDLITCKSYIHRMRQYEKARQQLSLLYPDKFSKQKMESLWKKAFYGVFGFSLWPYLIDRTSALRILPMAFRYKMYDWITYSLGMVFPNKPI